MKIINYREMGNRIRKQIELLGYTKEQLAKLTDILNLSIDYILLGECTQGISK